MCVLIEHTKQQHHTKKKEKREDLFKYKICRHCEEIYADALNSQRNRVCVLHPNCFAEKIAANNDDGDDNNSDNVKENSKLCVAAQKRKAKKKKHFLN